MAEAATRAIETIPLDQIQSARERIAGSALRSPLVAFTAEGTPAPIWLKLENLQPIGSFKLRGACNAMLTTPREVLARGVVTASAGNMAQGVAWNARRMGIACTVVVPEHAPPNKLEAIARLGGRVVKLPFDRWWQVLVDHGYPGIDGHFIHPVSDPAVIAGNGTIGLEILEDLPDVDAVVVPFGGGGLSCGIACAIQAAKPGTAVYAAEAETAAPFSASRAAGHPVAIDYRPSFVDGIGGRSMLPEMWPLASRVLASSIVVTLAQVADAIRLLAMRNRVIAEGAGACSVAGAMSGKAGRGKIVCVVSGGNIEMSILSRILAGVTP